MKTAKMTFENVKDPDGWSELGSELGLSDEQMKKTFEYGDYGKFEIEVDENLNIIGGRIIPCGEA